MNNTAQIVTAHWRKGALILIAGLGALLLSRAIASGLSIYFLSLIGLAGVLFLFWKQFELFILLLLIINQEFFQLLPRAFLGEERQYQGLLFLVLPLAGVWFFLFNKKQTDRNLNILVLVFAGLALIGIINSSLQGQPFMLGVKAAKGYYLILFYFVFVTRKIDVRKFSRSVVIVGLLLTLVNNVQYIYFGKLTIFNLSREMERAGQLRFLIGEMFMLYAPMLALGEYLQSKKRFYLFAFIYMLATVIIQGQTRGVIWGFAFMGLFLFYMLKKLNVMKVVLVGVPLVALFLWVGPLLQKTFLGELYELTKYEISGRQGNVGVRYDTYGYYFGEVAKSPIFGRGIWNDAYRGNNPEDMSYKDMYLSDVGITSLFFHLGLAGAVWLCLVFARVYKFTFTAFRRIRENAPLGIVAYFVFSFATLPTLNCLLASRTTLYLALSLAILSQMDRPPNDSDQLEPAWMSR